MFPASIPIEDSSAAAEARRIATKAAMLEGLNESRTGAVAIVASEIATNLHKHAGGGVLVVSRMSAHSSPGVEMLSIDRGPGIADMSRCLADGYSSSATSGTGLGAIRRMAQDFRIYTQPGKGTVMVARIWHENATVPDILLRAGAVCLPKAGEEACGDAWTILRNTKRVKLMVADGLGHGTLAAAASSAATLAFDQCDSSEPAILLKAVHSALRGTRGAAVAVAVVDNESRRIQYAGLGNISGLILGGDKEQHMVSQNGTAGHETHRVHEFEYTRPDRGILIMHSDGILTNWNLDSYPGLIHDDPSLTAAVLYRDANRERDDVCIVALGL
jgi:anti-sigma regulatory factor (Ser/Thr protein kinase)